jgi:hypothetical protein
MRGCRCRNFSCCTLESRFLAVRIQPGEMLFTLIPFGPNFHASSRVSWATAALLMP